VIGRTTIGRTVIGRTVIGRTVIVENRDYDEWLRVFAEGLRFSFGMDREYVQVAWSSSESP
jgi:hypothetical protein